MSVLTPRDRLPRGELSWALLALVLAPPPRGFAERSCASAWHCAATCGWMATPQGSCSPLGAPAEALSPPARSTRLREPCCASPAAPALPLLTREASLSPGPLLSAPPWSAPKMPVALPMLHGSSSDMADASGMGGKSSSSICASLLSMPKRPVPPLGTLPRAALATPPRADRSAPSLPASFLPRLRERCFEAAAGARAVAGVGYMLLLLLLRRRRRARSHAA